MKNLILASLFLFGTISINGQTGRTDVLQDLEQNQTVRENSATATLKSSSRLFGAKDDLTTAILIIPSGSTVEVIDSDSTYLHVVFEESEGYIFKRHAVIQQAPQQPGRNNQPVSEQRTQPVQQNEQPQQRQEGSRFSYLENKYGSSIAARLMAGKVWKGMNGEMVKDSWGNPKKINRVISNNRIKEEWIYNNSWLYIENDMLVEWGPRRR
jgi:hypothetical protein